MPYKYLTKEEAYTLWEAKAPIENRYKNANPKSNWDQTWTKWKPLEFRADDWRDLDPNQWDDEFRVEVE